MISLICGIKSSNSLKQRVQCWPPGTWGGGNGEIMVKGTKFYLQKMNKFWRYLLRLYTSSIVNIKGGKKKRKWQVLEVIDMLII